MVLDPWLPVGFALPGGVSTRAALAEGQDWQIYETAPEGRVLVAREDLARSWVGRGLLEADALASLSFGAETYRVLASDSGHLLAPVDASPRIRDGSEALAFSIALRETRKRDATSNLQGAVYVERFSRLLPVLSTGPEVADDLVLGTWLSGGVRVSAQSLRRLSSLTRGLSMSELQSIVEAAGLRVAEKEPEVPGASKPKRFELPGRATLEAFFSEHVIDIIENASRYKALGIEFPAAIALHGPPGCGKTFAVNKLIEYLGWPSQSIDSSSIGSPYIHETGRKIAKVFDEALRASPAIIVIDEMDAFLSDRQLSGGQGLHHVEEVAEFLRRIPEAIANNILVIGMTNRIETIDPALLRRGRFDHVIAVDMPTEEEVRSLLARLLSQLPCEKELDVEPLVGALTGRPLSDVAFVVREGARLTARAGKSTLDGASLTAALKSLPPREGVGKETRKIGFGK
ncbi:ATP-binding protein [Hyalangium sp.]|uniref:ATP-binding protein n=1 Tax=Hyalangium sp. TaxID=2028555 RepID=UPI002D6F4215|nr:ATP-binding protein [Hyalangium sp.]HYI01812.1 ATP-binding protein [Hyalangium sp.]